MNIIDKTLFKIQEGFFWVGDLYWAAAYAVFTKLRNALEIPEQIVITEFRVPLEFQDRLEKSEANLYAASVANNGYRMRLAAQVDEVDILRDELDRAKAALAESIKKNQSATRVFGEAFFGNTFQQVGPNRANRKKLSREEVARIRDLHRSGTSQAELANMFDVNPATISRTVRGIYNSQAA